MARRSSAWTLRLLWQTPQLTASTGKCVDLTALSETAQSEKSARGLVGVRNPDGLASVCPFHASLALGRRRGYDTGYSRKEPGAGKAPAQVCEGETEWLSYSTTTGSDNRTGELFSYAPPSKGWRDHQYERSGQW